MKIRPKQWLGTLLSMSKTKSGCKGSRNRFFALFIAITMIVCLLPVYPVSAATPDEIETAYQIGDENDNIIELQDGDTYSISNFKKSSQLPNGENLVVIRNPGTYIIEGYAPNATGRIIILADCTLNLNNVHMTTNTLWEKNASGALVSYKGGTKGAIEIADNVTVNLILNYDNIFDVNKNNQISDSSQKYHGILLGNQSHLIVSGSGKLEIGGSIGTRLSKPAELNSKASLTLTSGLLACSSMGSDNDVLYADPGMRDPSGYTMDNITLNYQGGSFYNWMDETSYDDYENIYGRTDQAIGNSHYRIKIPASGTVSIRREPDGTFSQAMAYGEYVYAWVYYQDINTEGQVLYGILSDAGYHLYQASLSDRYNDFLIDATLVDDGDVAVIQGKVHDPNHLLSAEDKLTFTDKNGKVPDVSVKIGTDRSYHVMLPLGTYKPQILSSQLTFEFDDVVAATAGTYEQDFTLASSLPDIINVYSVDDLNDINTLGTALNGKTINIMADVALPDDFPGIRLVNDCSVTVNGNNYTISNMKKPLFHGGNTDHWTLSGSVKDLKLQGDIYHYNAGAVADFAKTISIENCSFQGKLRGVYVGGFIGATYAPFPEIAEISIKNCLVEAEITTSEVGGGLIGKKYNGAVAVIENCGVHISFINTDNKDCGGLLGRWQNDKRYPVSVKNSYLFVDDAACTLYQICGKSQVELPAEPDVISHVYYNNSVAYQEDTSADSNVINNQAAPMDSALMNAAAGTEGALVDVLNANVTSENGYNRWSVKDGSLPTFEPDEETSVEPTYSVTIPESVTLGGTVTVSASGVTVAEGYALNVSIDGEFALTDSSISEQYRSVPYSVYMGENATCTPLVSGDNVLSVDGGTTDGSAGQVLYFSEPSQLPKYSGNYTGTVTFTVSVDAINA